MVIRLLTLLTVIFLTGCCLCCNNKTSETLYDDTIKTYVSGKKPAVVYFYSEWCGSCRKFAPIFDQVKSKMGQQAEFIKIDSSGATSLPGKYNVQGLPTVVIVNPESDDFISIPYRLLWDSSDFEEFLELNLSNYSPGAEKS